MIEELWSVLSPFLVFCFGLSIIIKLRCTFNITLQKSILIYCWHTLFCLTYYVYSQNYISDSSSYYANAVAGAVEFSLGTAAIDSLTSFLVHILMLDIVGCFLFFNIIGSIGLLAFAGSLKQATIRKSSFYKRLATLIIFLPSVSFWSSAIGKDAISFLAVGLALWSALQLNSRIKLMLIAVALMFLVRPHMAGMLVIAIAMSILFDSEVSLNKRLYLGALAVFSGVLMVPFALQYAGVDDPTSLNSLLAYIEKRQSYNMDGGGGVDISNMMLPLQLFTYMFRPVIFEVTSITTLAAAIDNTVLLYLFIIGSYSLMKNKRKDITENRYFMWFYVFLAWTILALTSANLGIAIRQKWMFAPMLIFLFLSSTGKDKKVPYKI
jgi:hypothetical protein